VNDFLDRARLIADEVLFPAALDVDLSATVPDSHFQLLAEEGFYGIVAPEEIGGAGLDLAEVVRVLEVMAGGCLSTAFTWMQHHGVVLALADTDNTALWAEYLGSAVNGRIRAGVAFAGALPRPPALRAIRVAEGFLLTGESPFVSGWDSIDVLLLSSAEEDPGGDVIVSGLVDRAALDGVQVDRLDLAAGQATNTVRLTFEDYFLPAERITRQVRRSEFVAGQWFVSRINGSLSLGIAGRCVRLLAEHGRPDLADLFGAQVTHARNRLDAALEAPDAMPSARAEAGELAYRVAGATVAALGSSAILAGHHAQRMVREAMFVLVAGGRPEIKAGLVELFGRSPVVAGRQRSSVFPPLTL
jgi:alkylation response protein AidB-like acyl-CoA dehydrogenase